MLPEYTQLQCGTDASILEADFARYKSTILTKNWIMECWRYMSLCKSTLMISGLWTPNTTRKGDSALMDEFTTQGMTDAQMRDINRCRIYLRVFYNSDFTDLAGNTIEEWAKQGKRQANRTSKWNWPETGHSPKRHCIGRRRSLQQSRTVESEDEYAPIN
jgi:hypothetical protein